MPNHVRNIVKMKGITTLRLFTESVTSRGNEWAFDFNRIIPMPGSLKLKAGSMEDLAIETALRSDAVLRYEFEKIKPSKCSLLIVIWLLHYFVSSECSISII